jgi:neutral ceramidase
LAPLRLSVRKVDITPRSPVSLLGYFNRRISTGSRDPLHCRIARLSLEGKKGSDLLFIGIDTCCILKEDADRIKAGIEKQSGHPPERVMIFATHTHTAPALGSFFETVKEREYLAELEGKILGAVSETDGGSRVEVRVARRAHSALSYNRRWYMKDGSVVTNPPKRSPLRDRPEGPADREVRTVLFLAEPGAPPAGGAPVALFVNISNHADTVGGTLVSADWPGFLERFVNLALKKKYPGASGDVPVFTFLAPQGNVNHFDFDNPRGQTRYAETERLGRAYARLVIDSIADAKEASVEALRSGYREVPIPPAEIGDAELERARSTLAADARARVERGDLTSEAIARGDPCVERLFARALLDFHRSRPASYPVPLQVLEVGPVAFCGIPGEPFVEIGLALEAFDEERFVVPVALANGYFGYIPLEECFDRGGYEVRPGGSVLLSRRAAGVILEEIKNLLKECHSTR